MSAAGPGAARLNRAGGAAVPAPALPSGMPPVLRAAWRHRPSAPQPARPVLPRLASGGPDCHRRLRPRAVAGWTEWQGRSHRAGVYRPMRLWACLRAEAVDRAGAGRACRPASRQQAAVLGRQGAGRHRRGAVWQPRRRSFRQRPFRWPPLRWSPLRWSALRWSALRWSVLRCPAFRRRGLPGRRPQPSGPARRAMSGRWRVGPRPLRPLVRAVRAVSGRPRPCRSTAVMRRVPGAGGPRPLPRPAGRMPAAAGPARPRLAMRRSGVRRWRERAFRRCGTPHPVPHRPLPLRVCPGSERLVTERLGCRRGDPPAPAPALRWSFRRTPEQGAMPGAVTVPMTASRGAPTPRDAGRRPAPAAGHRTAPGPGCRVGPCPVSDWPAVPQSVRRRSVVGRPAVGWAAVVGRAAARRRPAPGRRAGRVSPCRLPPSGGVAWRATEQPRRGRPAVSRAWRRGPMPRPGPASPSERRFRPGARLRAVACRRREWRPCGPA